MGKKKSAVRKVVKAAKAPGPRPVPVALKALNDEIVRAFHFFNALHFGGKLSLPVIGYHPNTNGRALTLGHYKPAAWVLKHGEKVQEAEEIVFYSDLCLAAGIGEVLHTLLHEMIHQWQHHHGRPPTGRKNYHNKEFHEWAARVGLLSDPKDERGLTKDGPGFLAALKKFKPTTEGIPFRKGPALAVIAGGAGGKDKGPAEEGEEGAEGEEKPKESYAKWVCWCHYAVRVSVPYFDATCNVCKKPFRKAKDLDPKNPADAAYLPEQKKKTAGSKA